MPADEGHALHQWAIEDLKPAGVGVEIGTWCGRSTIYFAQAAREVGAMIVTIDHHHGSEEHQPGWEYHDPSLVDEFSGRIDTLPLFRRTMHTAKLGDVVIPMITTSIQAGKIWSTPLDFVFIDGGHSQQAAHADFDTWAPHIKPGGKLYIHDVFPNPEDGGRPPYEIYCRALREGFTELSSLGTLRRLVKQ